MIPLDGHYPYIRPFTVWCGTDFSICDAKNVEVVIINTGDEALSFEEELAGDVLEIITVFSARLYGLAVVKINVYYLKLNTCRKILSTINKEVL